MYSRLNYLRFFLAWSVLAFHTNIHSIPMAGPIAVWCFFFISGFLISNILYNHYADRPGDFIVNRFLRIFPAYWAALIIGLTLISLDLPGFLQVYKHSKMPAGLGSWLRTVFIFTPPFLSNFVPVTKPLVVPVARSLEIELNWYLILFMGRFLPKPLTIGLLFAGLLSPLIIFFGLHKPLYGSWAGFPFCLGALAYHFEIRPPKIIQLISLLALVFMMFVEPVLLHLNVFRMNTLPASFLLLGSVIFLFLSFRIFLEKKQSSRLSDLAGDLSYPLFLIHLYAVYVAMKWFGVPRLGWMTLTTVTVLSVILSLLICLLVERPIGRIRKKIRNRSTEEGKLFFLFPLRKNGNQFRGLQN